MRAADGGLGILAQDGPLPEISADAPAADLSTCLDVDVVFPVLHGPWGEDGTVQGLLETLGVPYVGSGVLSSAVAMDKGFMKAALASAGLEVGRYVVVSDREWRADAERVLADVADLGFPVFVKPARAGSSLGIVRVTEADALRDAIEGARKHDPRVIVEAAVSPAREVECGVLVDADEQPRASRCAEIIVNARHEFYDFEAKYLDDSATLVVPADLPADVEERVRDLAVRPSTRSTATGWPAWTSSCATPARWSSTRSTRCPGFTSISMYPRMWAATGSSTRSWSTASSPTRSARAPACTDAVARPKARC